ncbi:MAG: hypothetical protein ACK57P_18900 [Planctomycetota bacterium]
MDARGVECQPALGDLKGSPGIGHLGIDPDQQEQVVIHHTETGDGDGEQGVEFSKALIEPGLAIEVLILRDEKRAANATGDAVIPAGDVWIDDLGTGLSHSEKPPSGKSGLDELAST